jgi:two-component system, response regulator PdtaR
MIPPLAQQMWRTSVGFGCAKLNSFQKGATLKFKRASRFNGVWNDSDQTSLSSVSQIPSNGFVVVVDDDVFERMGASCMFADEGYRVLEAENADEALRFFETHTDISLLFTDVSMPGSMSGSDLAHQVAERWPMVGIIITSGRPRPDPLPLGTQFHAKPYQPTSVLQHARDMMGSAWMTVSRKRLAG